MDHVSAFKTIQSNYNRSMKAIAHKQAKNISSHFDKILVKPRKLTNLE